MSVVRDARSVRGADGGVSVSRLPARALFVESCVAAVGLTVIAALVFGPHVLHGGLYSDDWWLGAMTRFPESTGGSSTLDTYWNASGSRFVSIAYWVITHELFGTDAKAYLALALMLGVLMSVALFAFLREFGFARLEAGAVSGLLLVLPAVDTLRFWHTPAFSQFAVAACLLGALLTLRAFETTGRRRIALHAASVSLYLLAVFTTESVTPAIAVLSLLYLVRIPLRACLARWVVDAGVILLALILARLTVPWVDPSASDQWLGHARHMANQALLIFTQTLFPFAPGARPIIVAAVAVVVTASVIVVRQRPHDRTRSAMTRWLGGLAGGIALATAGYALYVPAAVHYTPLNPGLGNRINVVPAAGYALAIAAILVLAYLLLARLGVWPQRAAGAATAVLAVGVVWDSVEDIREDQRVWQASADAQYRTLRVAQTTVPNPVPDSTLFTFGQAGSAVPGLNVFRARFELNGAIKLQYGRGDVRAYPVVEDWVLICGPRTAWVQMRDTREGETPYGRVYLVDIGTSRARHVMSRRQCIADSSAFKPGPSKLTNLKWST